MTEPINSGPPSRREVPSDLAAFVLEGLSEEDAAEAVALRERVVSRPKRAAVTLAKPHPEGPYEMRLGTGSDVSNTLHTLRLFDKLGTRSDKFVDDFMKRLSAAVGLTGDDAKGDSEKVSAALAMVAAIDPENELEATMALQMVAANEAALQAFRRSRSADWMEHASSYSNMANKAMRSFALHAESIAKLRRGGEQVVRHVHVNQGGQAVIAGTVNAGKGGG